MSVPKRSALETSRWKLSERRTVRCWHPLGCRAIELGKPPHGGVIYTVVDGTLVFGVFYEMDWEKGVSKISQETFAEHWADEYGIEFGKSVPLPVGTRLAEFDENEASGHWPFRELVGSLMWLSTQTRPDASNAVRAVARYCGASKIIQWRAALVILGDVRRTGSFGITFQRCIVGGPSLQVFAAATQVTRLTGGRYQGG